RHDDVRAPPGEADEENLAPSPFGMQHGAAAAFAMGVDQFFYRRLDAGLCKGRDNQDALPGSILVLAPMLDRAAAAGSKMRTDRLDTLATRRQDRDDRGAVALAFGLDGLAGQGIRNKDRALGRIGDAVPGVTHMVDRQLLHF